MKLNILCILFILIITVTSKRTKFTTEIKITSNEEEEEEIQQPKKETKNNTNSEKEEEEEKEEKKGNNNNINKAKVGDLSLKKTNSKNKSSTDNKKSPILLDLIKSKPSIEVKIIGHENNSNNSSTRPIKKKSSQKDELAEKNIPTQIPKKIYQ